MSGEIGSRDCSENNQSKGKKMKEEKYKIASVSGNSKCANQFGDRLADSILTEAGFVNRDGRNRNANLFIGCVPANDKSFFVYHAEPISDSERGTFRLVRVEDNGNETVIDQGSAGKSHPNRGLLTFYAGGSKLPSWSFHCEPIPASEKSPCEGSEVVT